MSIIERTGYAGGQTFPKPGQADPGAFLVDIPQLYRTVWPFRFMISAVVALCVVAAVFTHAVIPSKYEASVALLIDPHRLQVVDRDVRSAERFNADDNIVDTQMRVITTDSVLRSVVQRLDLASDPEFIDNSGLVGALRATIGRMIGLSSAPEPAELRALRHLRNAVGTMRAGSSYVIEIYVRTKDAEKSVVIADAIAQAYLDGEFAASSNAAQRAARSLSVGLDELRAQVRESEGAVARYRAEHDIAGGQGQLVTEQQLSELNVQLIQASVATETAKSRLDQWERMVASGSSLDDLAEAVGSPEISQLRTQYALARQRHSEALQVYGERHPRLRPLAAQLEAIRLSIRDELARISGAARNAYERAVDNERSLRTQLELLKQNSFESGFAQVRLRELERELETNRIVYQSFMQRTQEVTEQQEVDVTNARVVTTATVPDRSTKPSLLFVIVVVAALSFGMSAASIIVREQIRRADAH